MKELLNINEVHELIQTEIHSAKSLLTEPGLNYTGIGTEKLIKLYNFQDINYIHTN
jgi:hypothetical protein